MADRSKLSRRTVVQSLAAATAAPFVPGCTPEDQVDPGTLSEAITHVVVLMMENRTFDTYLGSLSLVEGRTDIDGLVAGLSNFDANGTEYPVHLADLNCVRDPPHGWTDSHEQWNDGAMDGFVREHVNRHGLEEARAPMQYWTRDTLSALYSLTDHYTTCDAWFGSVMTSTWPNRFYSHAGTNKGITGNDFLATYDMPTIYHRLDAAGIEWRNYHLTAPFMAVLPGHFDEEHFHGMERFYVDAQYGLLKPVTVLEPFYGRADDHPPAHPKAGQILIKSIYDALANSPHWGNTLLFITYDEHGGFYDHVPPPTMADAYADQGFGQAGARVPGLVVGPYVKAGHASHTVYDHSSMLAFMQTLWGLDPLTDRDAAANDFLDVFDVDRVERRNPAAPVTLAAIDATEEEIFAEECIYSLERDEPRSVYGQPELEAWLDSLVMQHPTDNRETVDRDYDAWLELTESMSAWRRV